MAEDINDDYMLENALPPNLSIIKEEISIIDDGNLSLIKPEVEKTSLIEGNKEYFTSAKIDISPMDQFPKPIIVPKIEVDVTNNIRPKIVDMFDLDTEYESEDSTEEDSDTIVSHNDQTLRKKRDLDLVSEEIDLGTNLVTKDGDVKIYGLADNLGLHLPKTGFNLEKNSGTSVVSSVKSKNIARKKTTPTNVICKTAILESEQKYLKSHELPRLSRTIVFENKASGSNGNTMNKGQNGSFFGNKIILGNRSNSKVSKTLKCELKVVAKDCYSDYVNSPNYCTDCDILFTTYKAFDIHYIEKHLNNVEHETSESKRLHDDDKRKDLSHENAVELKKATKNAKKGSKDKNNYFVKFKCKICSTIISTNSNMKRHLNNIHNAKYGVNLFEKIEVANAPSVKTSLSNAKLQENSIVNESLNKDSVVKKTSNVPANSTYESSDSSDENDHENSDYEDEDEPLFDKIKNTKTNTNDKDKSSKKPGPNNIADLVSKIKNNHCIHCDKTFTNKEEIINHLYDLLLPQIFTCNICKEEFVSEIMLKKHFISHNDGVKIKIARLSEEEINKYLHKNLDDNKSLENGSDDGTSDHFDNDLTQNDVIINSDEPESDDSDDFNTKNVSKKGIDTKKIKFKCKLCFSTTSNIGNMKRHIKSKHHIKTEQDSFKRVIVSKYNRKKAVNSSKFNTHDNTKMRAGRPVIDNLEDINIDDESNPLTDLQTETLDTPLTDKKHKNEVFVKIMNKCLKIIENKSDTDNHSKMHPNIEKVNNYISKPTFNSAATLNNTTSSPVPKTVLFKCKSCYLHYISCWAARAHVNKCSGPKPSWECPQCFKTFKFSNKDMHERQHQYLGDEEFVVYSMDKYNRNELTIKVMHCCPKCGVHYSESRFTKHYNECEQEIPKSYFCLKCDVLIGEVHKEQHNKLHTFNKYNVEDLIIIEYESTDADLDDLVRIDGDETLVKNNNNQKTVDTIDENLSDDSQCEVGENDKAVFDDIEPNDIEIKTDCRVARLIYCETCKTYISPFKPNNLAHFYGYCSNLIKKTCTVCGLAFTCRSIYSHRNLHKRLRNFSIFNLVFYNMRFEQIDPAIPALPKCSHCLLTFECLESKVNHECGERKYKSCYYCGDDFNELAYKTHILFHEYVNRKTILPMSSNDILKLQSIIQKKAVGSTYNFTFYQCKECSVVLDEINRDMHKKAKGNCLDLSHTYKKCFKCQLTILAKEFAHHSARHERNSTFKLENFNIIQFQRNAKGESKKKAASVKKNNSWVSISKINVLETAQRHSLKHSNNSIDTNNKKKEIIKPIFKRKRKLANEEIKANNKKKKTKIDEQTDSDGSTFEIMDTAESPILEVTEDRSDILTNTLPKEMPALFKCRSCHVVLLEKPTTHKCSDTQAEQQCDLCTLKFYKNDYDAHKIFHSDPQTEIEKSITYFGEKVNENTVKTSEIVVDKIYRCLCGLNFVTKAGILNHYTQCNITTRVVKQNCTKCNLLFTPQVLFNHLVTHHSKNRDFNYEIVDLTEYTSENRDDIYLCDTCNAHFVVKELCEIHVENCKSEDRRFIKKCPSCNLDFNVESLPLHRRKHHAAKRMKVEDFDVITIKPKTNEPAEESHDEIKETSVFPLDKTADVTPTAVHWNTIDNIDIDSEIVTTERNLKLVADKLLNKIVLENYSHVLYKCVRCDLHFTGFRAYKGHVAKNHAQNIVVVACSVCLLKFSSENCMRHEYIHHTKMNLKLEDFEIRNDYVKPKKEKKEPIEHARFATFTLTEQAKEKILRNKKLITKKIYKCSKCDIYFLTPNSAFIHVRRFNHRLSRKVGKCDVCDISMSAQTLERHKFIHHELNNYQFKDLKVKVDVTYCYTKSGKRFDKSSIDLNKYSNKIYKCRQCDLGHLTFGALTHHILENNHQNKTQKVKCSICNENFAPLGLAKHKYVHHKTFKLNKNEFEYEDEVSLNDFIENRREERMAIEWQKRSSKQTIIYRCKECNLCLLSRKTWRNHNYVHVPTLETQKHKCDECGLYFKRVPLRVHQNMHHRVKGYTLNDFWIEEEVSYRHKFGSRSFFSQEGLIKTE